MTVLEALEKEYGRDFLTKAAMLDQKKVANAMGGGQGYLSDDSGIDYGIGGDFKTEDNGTFTIKLKNTTDAPFKIALNPAYYTEAAQIKDENGIAVDGILQDGAVADGIISTASPLSVVDLFGYFTAIPARIKSIRTFVEANKVSNLDIPLEYSDLSRFGKRANDRITPSDYVNNNTQQLNMSETKAPGNQGWILSKETLLLYTIPANSEISLLFRLGATNNPVRELANKAEIGLVVSARDKMDAMALTIKN
ncbi:MAG: hypothetical protein LBN27_11160 [Prevotellaceae bacterium]|jgi:hypothetical protein|nr:hypothetical protein [Prevotellaceae bacterium]